MGAAREPPLLLPGLIGVVFAMLAVVGRRRRWLFASCVGLAAVFAGFFSATWRTARIAAPVLDHIRIVHLTGFIEQMDFRRTGARFLLRVAGASELAPGAMPYRVRLTIKRTPEVEAGAFVAVTARLLPPAHAALPGGYDFARDAYFSRIGAVGSVLGGLTVATPASPPDFALSAATAIDRLRNALARRVFAIVGGDAGAIAAAMVTGKRDFLSEDARELIREAGIFHIITISGVQMTLVAGILFVAARRLLALSRTLALHYPIKAWAAVVAMLGAIGYDIMTGSRIGTQRALFMTLIMLGSVLVGRRAFTMRNLAYAALAVIAVEPEAILGASFQLSFAAVAALVAVYEARVAAASKLRQSGPSGRPPPGSITSPWRALSGLRHLLFATLCATTATASFMAYNFHELSPYVLIGNPLTLALIELFAVPGALIGTVLYPLGLDGPVWVYVGAGIKFIIWIAGYIAAAPGSTLHLDAFAPSAILFLSLAVLSLVIWRTPALRLTALPLVAIGLWAAASGPHYDVIVAPTGDIVAVRGSDGRLGILAARANDFAAQQWLSADGEEGLAGDAGARDARCDRLGCVARLADGRALSLVLQIDAFEEDCARAAVIVSRLAAPKNCKAAVVIDAERLGRGGATALTFADGTAAVATARTDQADRPWSPAPPPRKAWRPEGSSTKPEAASDEDTGSGANAPPEPAAAE
ncbi:MAG: ComEC family competence protein [Methylobacteriaceae bacterium]|nr:ComEC family competence protein [Methylobacteriaceae bacterium]